MKNSRHPKRHSDDPSLPGEQYADLEDAAFELVSAASSVAGQLNPTVRGGVGELVRSMNCYYSNLIEGHNTLPRDIERALAKEYSAEPQKRNLQLGAVHTLVALEFCSRLPEDLLWLENPGTGERLRITPGEIRTRGVKVGMHVPPTGEDLQVCLQRFHEAYAAPISKFRKIVAVAAAHHRLLWIHPFLDGNGRVARLMAHAMFNRLGIRNSLWSVSRGLARNVAEYKVLLMSADSPRQGDYDGRGNLSERALVEFCRFFLGVSLDQVRFMQSILDPENLLRRIELYCRDEVEAGRLPKASYLVLREAVLAGEVGRSRVPSILNLQERAARNVTSSLVGKKLLVSENTRAPFRLGFPAEAVEHWFPSLYPAVGT